MKILFCAQDPGGANSIIPLIRHFRTRENCKVWGARFASALLARQKIAHLNCTDLTVVQLQKHLKRLAPSVIIMGTSSGKSLEKTVTGIARRLGIPTISLIDYWSNYSARFSAPQQPLGYLTDFVCVIDKAMKRGCEKEGIPGKRLYVTGSPYLDECLGKIKNSREKKQLVFISQPFSKAKPPVFPFTEFSVLKDILDYKHIASFNQLIIKNHPKETARHYRSFLAKRTPLPLKVEISAEPDVYKVVSASQVIIGMNSIVLLEAALAGKTVFSYEPGWSQKRDPLPSNKFGLSQVAYHKTKLYYLFDRYLANRTRAEPLSRKKLRLQVQYAGNDSVDKISKFLYTKVVFKQK